MVFYQVNNEFQCKKDYLLSIPDLFPHTGIVFRNDRNVIKRITSEHGDFVVKSFVGMYFLNRVMYSLFRKTKSERSFLYSKLLNAKGIRTPAAVAWIDYYRWGFLQSSYFVNEFSDEQTYEQRLNQLREQDHRTKVVLLEALAAFVFHMHKLGFFHDDLSPGNILISREQGDYKFSLLDLNRMRIGPVSFRKGIQNFVKIGLPNDEIEIIIKAYAAQHGRPGDAAVKTYWRSRKIFAELIDFRRAIRRNTLGVIENIFGFGKAARR